MSKKPSPPQNSVSSSESVGPKWGGNDHVSSNQIAHNLSFVAWPTTGIPSWRDFSEPGEGLFKITYWDFPGGPVVKTSPSNAGGAGSIPGPRAKIPRASQPKNQNIKQKQYCNKFNKD